FGAAAGSISGSFIGAFTDWGIREDQAQAYMEAVRRGGTLVIVKATGEAADRAATVISRHNPVNIEERIANWRKEGWTGVVNEAVATAGGKPTVGTGADPTLQAGKMPGVKSFEEHEADFRQHYAQHYASTDEGYEYYEPAYR